MPEHPELFRQSTHCRKYTGGEEEETVNAAFMLHADPGF
jgi:hypothetical protein